MHESFSVAEQVEGNSHAKREEKKKAGDRGEDRTGENGGSERLTDKLGNKSTARLEQVLISSPGSLATSLTARKAWRALISRN